MARLLVESAVRGTLIATVTAVILRATRIKAPVALHAAWAGVLLSMLLLPVWTAWGPRASMRVLPPVLASREILAAAAETVFQVPQADRGPLETVEATAPRQAQDWNRILLGVYIVVAWSFLARLATGTFRTHQLVRGAVRRDDRLTSAWCAAPITVGWFRPVAILPEHSHEWSRAQLDAVLIHEREHARRRDPLVQWLALLNRAVFWFHPLAWWLERRLAALAEDTCDAAVLARGHDAQDYAEYLVDIARAVTRAGSRVKVVGTAMPGPRLARRIEQLLNRTSAPRASRTRMVCTVAACAVSSAICAAATLEPVSPRRSGGISILTAPARAGARAEQILVTVNGESLTNADFTQRHRELQETIARLDASGQWRRNSGSNGRPEVLVDAVDDTLLVQRGKQLGYTFTDDQFKSSLDNIRKRYKIENDAQLQARLKREHLTIADLRQNMERRMILARLRADQIWAKSVFTEEEQRQYFEAHLNEFPLMQFEQARDLIDDHAVDKLQERKWAKYRSTLRSNAVIEWKRADLRRMYADGLVAPANALH
jgi:hypothetical protein